MGGPTIAGQTWTLEPKWVHGVEQLWSRSPRVPWRPTSGDVLAVRNPDTRAAHWALRGHAMLRGAGWHIAVAGWDGAAWVNVGVVSSRVSLGTGTRTGDVLEPSGVEADRPGRFIWYEAGELLDAWVSITDGSNQVLAPILLQPEGRWEQSAEIPLRIHLDRSRAVVAGSWPSSGTVALYMPQAALVHQKVSVDYAAWRYTVTWLPLTTVPDDLRGIGRLVTGEVAVMGQEYGWGRSVVTDARLEETEDEGDHVQIRQLAPPRRSVRIDWMDGVDRTQIQVASPSPDVVRRNIAGNPIAAVAGTPGALEGMFRDLANRRSQVVYLPRIEIPATNVTVQNLNRRADMVLGRLRGELTHENVMGDEGVTDLVRMAALTVLEET
jgi:hypothetical protein